MTDKSLDIHSDSMAEELTTVPQPVGSFFMSFAFWIALVIAALMYAAVSLSPKLADWISVRQQHAANAERLREMEEEVDYLERVAAALRKDPAFAHRLVDAAQSGNQQQAFVQESDSSKTGDPKVNSVAAKPLIQPAASEIVMLLASHQKLRNWILICASGLTVLAFTLLNDSGTGIMRAAFCTLQRFSQKTVARYLQERTEAPVGDEAETPESELTSGDNPTTRLSS